MGIPYLYDPSQQIVRMQGETLCRGVEGADSVFVNEYELDLLLKHSNLSIQQILERVTYLVVTCGDKGVTIYAEGTHYNVPAVRPKKIVDPTGVGDAFRGGFVRGRRLGLDWETCGRMGVLAATYCLEHSGTQNHHYTPDEFQERYRKIYKNNTDLGLTARA